MTLMKDPPECMAVNKETVKGDDLTK